MENKKKILIGKVIRTKMNKTIVVSNSCYIKHIKYGKYIKKIKIFFVHDEDNICKKNDIISFISSRPISKKKHWILLNKVSYDTN